MWAMQRDLKIQRDWIFSQWGRKSWRRKAFPHLSASDRMTNPRNQPSCMNFLSLTFGNILCMLELEEKMIKKWQYSYDRVLLYNQLFLNVIYIQVHTGAIVATTMNMALRYFSSYSQVQKTLGIIDTPLDIDTPST